METLIQKTGDYLETRLELLRLKTVNKSSQIASTFITYSIFFAFIYLFVLMLSIGIALLLGQWLHNLWAGFLIMAGLHLIIFISGLIYLNKPIKRFIQNLIVERFIK